MEVHERLQDLRQRVLKGEEVSSAEYQEVIDDLREDRRSAAESKGKTSRKANVVEVDPSDIFDF